VIPSTPVKMKPTKLKPAARPRLPCSVPPIRPMKMNGKIRLKTRRPRSRNSLTTSREATVRIALSSVTELLHRRPNDLQVGIFERRCVRLQHRQRLVDGPDHLLGAAAVQHHLEGPRLPHRQMERVELAAQLRSVGGVQ